MKKFKRKVLAMLMTNNSGSNLRQQLFDGAPFCSELLYTAIPQRAASGTTATFTRATTATFPDFEGVLRTAPAGCARFVGARFVRNLLTYTEDFSNAVWVNASGNTITTNAVASPIDGAITADKITPPASAAFHSIYTSYALSGASTAYSIYVKNGGYNYAYISPDNGTSGVTINLTTGATSTTGSVTAYAIDAGNGWWRVACISTATTSNLRIYLGSTTAPQSFTGDGTSGIYVFGAQLENITGRADQTTPSEYVSVGVTSAPYYHGSMVDGVKCFATDLSGNPIPSTTMLGYQAQGARTNLCLQSNDPSNASWTKSSFITTTQNAVSPDGATNAWTIAATTGATFAVFLQNITVAADTNSYTASCFVKKTTGTPATYPMFELQHSSATKTAGVVINTTAGTLTNRSVGGAIVAPDAKTITSWNDDYWRVTVTLANNSGTTSTIAFYPSINSDGTGVIVSGTLGSAVFYGAQVELGSFASSYIATTTAAATRNADQLYYTGADIANIKTLAATFRREVGVTASGYIVALSDNTLNEFAASYLNTATQQRFNGYDGGVNQWEIISSNAYTPGATSKASWSMATNDVKADLDGTAQTADTSATLPAVTQLQVGHLVGLYQLNGPVNHIYGWTRNLSQSELGAVDR